MVCRPPSPIFKIRMIRHMKRPFLMGGSIALTTAILHAQLCEKAFREPPLASRPSALWTWMNAHVDRQQITRELKEMKDKGMRGAIIWDIGALKDFERIIPEGPPFLGPESLASIHHAMDQAERLGLELGIIASSSWNAGGPWIKEEDGCQTLAWSTVTVKGPQSYSAVLPKPEKAKEPTTVLGVMAVPAGSETIDASKVVRLDGQVDSAGRLTWSVPDGEWSVMTFFSTATGQQLMCPSPKSKGLMVDHLSARAARNHFNHVLDALMTGRKDFGSLKVVMLDSYEVKTPVDWTPDFCRAYQKAYGYDPLPWLPVLAGKTVANPELSERFRHDYGKLVSDLKIKNHYALAREMVNARGLQLLAEAGHGGYARLDTLKALGSTDIPMGEFWNHSKNWCVKEAASAANLYGKTLVNAESMTGWQHWQDGPQMYKRLTDIAFCAGLNQISFHTFAHNPPEAGLPGYAYHAGEHFNVNLTWWPQARPLLDTLSRSCHMLQQGRFVADVCAYYGDGAPNLVPARRIAPTDKPRWTDDKCLHCGRPHPVDLSSLGENHDYDYLNEEILLTMEVRDGVLTIPSGMQYRVLVLPDSTTISPSALEKIGQLIHNGATVIGPKPERSISMLGYPRCDEKIRELAGRIWGNGHGARIKSHNYGRGRVVWNMPIQEVLADMGVAPDFSVSGTDNSSRKIDYIHRTTGNEEIYFLTNSTEEHIAFEAVFRVGDSHLPSLWNPEDGGVSPCLQYQATKNNTRIPFGLAPSQSVFVIFKRKPDNGTPEHITRIQRPAGTPGSTLTNEISSKVIAIKDKQVQLHARDAGTYSVTTNTGRTGSATLPSSPAPQAIQGPWRLVFPPDRGAPATASFDQLADWATHSEPGIKYFSGTATYHNEFTIDVPTSTRIELDLGAVREVATVTINGSDAGILWKPPYRIDITEHIKPGTNQLSIAVTNTWNNRLVGDAQRDDDTDITRTNMRSHFKPNSPLKPSGLIGPVTLETHTPLTIVLGEPES
jgi:hypothetical protein